MNSPLGLAFCSTFFLKNSLLYQVPLSSLSLSTILDKGTLSASTPFQHTPQKGEKGSHPERRGSPKKASGGEGRQAPHPNPV